MIYFNPCSQLPKHVVGAIISDILIKARKEKVFSRRLSVGVKSLWHSGCMANRSVRLHRIANFSHRSLDNEVLGHRGSVICLEKQRWIVIESPRIDFTFKGFFTASRKIQYLSCGQKRYFRRLSGSFFI